MCTENGNDQRRLKIERCARNDDEKDEAEGDTNDTFNGVESLFQMDFTFEHLTIMLFSSFVDVIDAILLYLLPSSCRWLSCYITRKIDRIENTLFHFDTQTQAEKERIKKKEKKRS